MLNITDKENLVNFKSSNTAECKGFGLFFFVYRTV